MKGPKRYRPQNPIEGGQINRSKSKQKPVSHAQKQKFILEEIFSSENWFLKVFKRKNIYQIHNGNGRKNKSAGKIQVVAFLKNIPEEKQTQKTNDKTDAEN